MSIRCIFLMVLILVPVFHLSAYYPYIEIYSEPENRYIRHIDIDDNSTVKVTTSNATIVFSGLNQKAVQKIPTKNRTIIPKPHFATFTEIYGTSINSAEVYTSMIA